MSAPAEILSSSEAQALAESFETATTEEILGWAWSRFGDKAAIGTSFQGAGLVMMHLAVKNGLSFPVFTIDTGLLFAETLELKKRLEDFFGFQIESVKPDISVDQMNESMGPPELWKKDPDLCCTVRKVFPLQSKLSELDCWITGLRREQSQSRASVPILDIHILEGDSNKELAKLSPMANWSREDVWKYIKEHKIPYNPLHDQGYRSIGCYPCTRQTRNGEDERAGRWTGFKKVECGIHTFMSRKIDFQI